MKGSAVVAAAVVALSGRVAAGKLHGRHAHPLLERRSVDNTCRCTTMIETIYGEPTLLGVTTLVPAQTLTQEVVVQPTPVVGTTSVAETVPPVVPTPAVEVCPTPGTYTFPATTITLTETTTVCGALSTKVPAGEHTIGGITTIVEQSTIVVCPYPTVRTDNGAVTSVIETTTYVCPSSGTYTIAPVVTSAVEETVVVIPVIETYFPGTYTRPEVITTVTETSVVVVCPYTASPVPELVEATSAVTVEVRPTAEASSVNTPKVQSSPKPAATESESIPKPQASSPATSVGGNSGDHYAMTYTPYNDDRLCKTKSQIDIDIAAIAAAGFTSIRVYSTDCNTLEWVGGACAANGLKIIIGVFIDSPGCVNTGISVSGQIDAIANWAQWNIVDVIVVGNEAIFNGHCTAAQISGLIGECKSKFSGYSGPYTTAETLNIWQKTETKSALCGAIDITGANIHPYFNAVVKPSSAGEFVSGQLDIVDTICPGKKGLNLECGWPSAGLVNGDAIPGPDEQALAIASIRKEAGSRTCFFSFRNDGWKDKGSCNCEQSWGCGSLF